MEIGDWRYCDVFFFFALFFLFFSFFIDGVEGGRERERERNKHVNKLTPFVFPRLGFLPFTFFDTGVAMIEEGRVCVVYLSI